MTSYKLFLFLFGVFLISTVTANGINVGQSSYSINKTYGEDYFVDLVISNQETFTFANISSDKIFIFDKFDLISGENRTIHAKINTNEDFNGQVRIKGNYFSTIGASNKTETTTLTTSGLDICDLNLIQGDSINFFNTLTGEVKLKNLNSGEYIDTVLGNSNKTIFFSTPTEFDYQVYKVGLPFSQVCHINIMATSGYIHNSDYDKIINLDLKIVYPATSISAEFLTSNFTIGYNSEESDIFKITNTGGKVAKNIHISGDWMTFTENNYDISSGGSKTINYKINPIISSTDQTNKTYTLTIKIEGNFPTIEKNISVSVPYQQIQSIGNSTLEVDKDSLKNTVNLICSIYPDICPTRTVYGNESDRNVTFTINEGTYKESILEEDRFREETRSQFGVLAGEIANIKNSTTNIENSSKETSEGYNKIVDSNDSLTAIIILVFLFSSAIVSAIIIIFIIRKKMINNKLDLNKYEEKHRI